MRARVSDLSGIRVSNRVNQGAALRCSEWESLEVRLLDAQTGLASGITVRYRADGSVMERVAVIYSLWSSEKGWKIILSATHAPESVLYFR